jgi:hypothetical protein
VLFAFVVAAYALAPVMLIWALNTLFGLSVPLDFWTWLAGLVLISLVSRPVVRKA